MAALQTVGPFDSWNSGRTKFNANDVALNNDIAVVNTNMATHKTAGDHDTHNDARYAPIAEGAAALATHKASNDHDAHNDARYAPLAATVQKVALTIPFSILTPILKSYPHGFPAGTIQKIIITMASGAAYVTSFTYPVGVSDGSVYSLIVKDDYVALNDGGSAGDLCSADFSRTSGSPVTATIIMVLS